MNYIALLDNTIKEKISQNAQAAGSFFEKWGLLPIGDYPTLKVIAKAGLLQNQYPEMFDAYVQDLHTLLSLRDYATGDTQSTADSESFFDAAFTKDLLLSSIPVIGSLFGSSTSSTLNTGVSVGIDEKTTNTIYIIAGVIAFVIILILLFVFLKKK